MDNKDFRYDIENCCSSEMRNEGLVNVSTVDDCHKLIAHLCVQIIDLTHENKILKKALKLACREADDLLIKHEGWRFGLASENNFDKYFELEQKGLEIQGHCDYFKQQAEKEINNGNSKS